MQRYEYAMTSPPTLLTVARAVSTKNATGRCEPKTAPRRYSELPGSDIQFADISETVTTVTATRSPASLTMGLDRRITSDLVVGMTVSLENSSTDAFDDTLGIDTDGFSFGPYAAYRLSSIDGSLTYGRYNNDIELSVLNGEQDSERLAGEISLHGQYKVDANYVRPKAFVTWSHINSDDYDLSGNILNIPVSVSLPGNSYTYGVLDLSTEISRYFRLPDGQPFLVFTELGGRVPVRAAERRQDPDRRPLRDHAFALVILIAVGLQDAGERQSPDRSDRRLPELWPGRLRCLGRQAAYFLELLAGGRECNSCNSGS